MANLTKQDLTHFTGDLERWRHQFNRSVIYTPGVRHVAEAGEAYWLIDAIASWIGSPTFNEAATKIDGISEWHTWTLSVGDNNAATLFATADEPADAFITQAIPYTDFPLSSIDVWAGYDGSHWTLYLPSEH